MDIAARFRGLCNNIRVPKDTVDTIQYRFNRIVGRIQSDFGDNSIYGRYVGSYGRNTAIEVSDIDVIVVLPWSIYTRYNNYAYNGQSALLQAVKSSISNTYSSTSMRGDGQVVVVEFSDGIRFEVVPGFEFDDGSFYYPDSHYGGSWKKTNPIPEQEAIHNLDMRYDYNCRRLCRMMRAWKAQNNVKMKGLLIDTYVARFIDQAEYRDKSYLYYDYLTRDFFKFLSQQDDTKSYIYAIGSNQHVYIDDPFVKKAEQAYNWALSACKNSDNDFLAEYYWQKIYGSKF